MIRNLFPSIRLAARTLTKRPTNRSGLVRRQWLRSSSSSTAYRPVAKTASRIPDVMLVHHVGTWKTVFLGVTKMATLIVFGYGVVELAPRAWNSPDAGPWVSVAVATVTAIPLVFTALYSRPYVLTVHLRIPLQARASPVALAEFTKNVPATCQMHITTMRLVPVPKTQIARLANLRKVQPRFGSIVNLELLDKPNAGNTLEAQPSNPGFWRNRTKKFCISENKLPTQKAVIWDRIWQSVPAAK